MGLNFGHEFLDSRFDLASLLDVTLLLLEVVADLAEQEVDVLLKWDTFALLAIGERTLTPGLQLDQDLLRLDHRRLSRVLHKLGQTAIGLLGFGRCWTWVVVAHVVTFLFFVGALFIFVLLKQLLDVLGDLRVDFEQVPSQVVVDILVDLVVGGVTCDPMRVDQLLPLPVDLSQLSDRQVYDGPDLRVCSQLNCKRFQGLVACLLDVLRVILRQVLVHPVGSGSARRRWLAVFAL